MLKTGDSKRTTGLVAFSCGPDYVPQFDYELEPVIDFVGIGVRQF